MSIINRNTGLTEAQERACSLLANGEKIEAVATALAVPEQTLYKWQRLKTFKCYYNKQRSNIASTAAQGLFSLADKAILAIKESLNSENEAVKLKAASYILDRLQKVEIGQTDIIEAVRAEATFTDSEMWTKAEFHNNYYQKRLEEYGVEDNKENNL